MLDLKTLQEQFFKGIINPDNKHLLSFIKPSNISENARFQIYKNTSCENLYNALKITFPGIWKLIGEECARSVSYAFIKDIKNLPSTGSIDDWGKDFPKFLSTVSELSNLKYLEDYACLEWLQHLSYCALDADIFDPAQLQKVPEDLIDDIKFSFHPSVFFLKSIYPLDQIYELLEDPGTQISKIDLNSGASYTIFSRSDNHVNTLWVVKDYFDFTQLMAQGKSLSAAISEMQSKSSDFEFSEILSFILSTGLLTSIIIPSR